MAVVDILLATYNGEQYIESQLLSLIGQSFRDWRLLIHDDGSTDTTVDIVKRWSLIDNRIQIIEDGIVCGGAAMNFMYLVKFADADYAMFCDQDDIWFNNKIEVMLDAIRKKNSTIPQVVYSNSYVWKPNKGIMGKATLTFPEKIEQFLFLNSGMQGCVSIFNRAMCVILSKWKGSCAMHDHLLHMAGLSLGEVEYLPLCLMLYRNHNSNVTGESSVKKINFQKIINNHRVPVVEKKHYDSICQFLKLYHEDLSERDKEIINTYLNLPNRNFIQKIFNVFYNGFQIYNSQFQLILKILLRKFK